MGKLLDKFVENMPRLQAAHIERDLFLSKERREIRSVKALREEFQKRLRALLESDAPLLYEGRRIFPGERRSSELMEYIFSRICDDLTALFNDSNTIAELSKIQRELFEDEILSRLRRAVDEAERELDRIELLYGNTTGLKDAIVEKFRTPSSRLPHSDPMAQFVYIDPKTNTPFSAVSDMPVEVNLGGLVLPVNTETTVTFSNIKDQQSADTRDGEDRFASPRDLEFSTPSDGEDGQTGRISSLIDKQLNTWWEKRVTKKRILPNGAKLTLVATMGQPREINFVEIQPVGDHSVELSEIYYVDEMAFSHRIEFTGDVVDVKEPTRVFFKSVYATKLILSFTQRSPISMPAFIDGSPSLTYQYQFGFDNILAGKLTYGPVGCYASRTISAPKITTLYLSSKENQILGADNDNPGVIIDPTPTIEYWVSFRDIDANGNIVYSTVIPILPSGITRTREKLMMREGHTATLNFMIDKELDGIGHDPTDLLVYRDGVQVLRTDDYAIDAGLLAEETIEAKHATLSIPDGFNEQKEYIADYTPLHTDVTRAPLVFTDPSGLIRYNLDNTINIERPAGSRAVESQANLIIIMRNCGNHIHTSLVDEFVFAIG